MKGRTLLILLILFTIHGCTLAPKYTRPPAPVPSDWPKGAAYKDISRETAEVVEKLKWEEFFQDEKLRILIDLALRNNRDLRLAALNVERARALYGIQRAELFPSINAAASGNKHRTPADLSSSGRITTSEQYSVNLGITAWEIDFFGRIRSLKDEALEHYLATKHAGQSARISLMSAVAYAYFALAADRENLALAQSTLKTQQEMYDLIKRRVEVGLASELDLRRAQTQVDAAKGDVARYTQLVARDENTLTLLIGTSFPQELLPSGLNEVKPPREVFPQTPSEILLNRPDIREAEHRLKASHANIGAARAAFFPRIALTTSIGTASAELSHLFKSGQGTWNFAPQIVMPIFDARTWSAYEVAKTEREIALTKYEKTIQNAFKEVADALAVHGTVEHQLASQQSLVDAMEETYRLAMARYLRGIDSYIGVLDAQRSLYGARKVLTDLKMAKHANQVHLYAVLGGGVE